MDQMHDSCNLYDSTHLLVSEPRISFAAVKITNVVDGDLTVCALAGTGNRI